jgi:hypothetical protein
MRSHRQLQPLPLAPVLLLLALVLVVRLLLDLVLSCTTA